ncbi:GH22995 [Drosophila grimshawi]|uniref:GH22995 n=1 Tax=Drosophila grimshawi TaxID=7222 RepID=B4JTH9_DROGR|nr:GH22995 [Drosophila grimshawi]
MISKAPLCFGFPWMLLLLIGGCISRRTWNFEIVSVSSYSANESMLNISVGIQQNSRHEMSMSAVIEWKFDADETMMVEFRSYRSYSGYEHDYKLLPYRI